MSQNILELIVKITGDITGLNSTLDTAANNSTAAVNEVGAAGEDMSKKVSTSFAGMGKALTTAVTTACLSAAAALAALAAGTATVVAKTALDYDDVLRRLTATTGAVGKDLETLGESVKKVFSTGLVTSMADAGEAVLVVKQNFQDLKDDNVIAGLAEDALHLKKVFGVDLNESIGAAQTLMESFGISSKEAFDMIAYGFQTGLDQGGDWLDTIQEYGVQFKESGFSAKEFFAIITTGAQNGSTLGTDKVADLIKEFGIRAVDGSKKTKEAFAAIGMNYDELSRKLSSGEMTKGQLFVEVQKRLQSMDDTVQRNTVHVDLMGTQYEDLGSKAVAAIDLTVDKQAEMSKAMENVRVQSQDFKTVFTSAWNQIIIALLPIGTELLNLAKSYMPVFIEAVKDVVSWIEEFVKKLQEAKDNGIPALEKFGQAFEDTKEFVRSFVQFVKDLWDNVLFPTINALGPTVEAALGVVIGILTIFKGILLGFMKAFKDIISGDWETAWQKFCDEVDKSIRSTNNILESFSEKFMKQFDAILKNVEIWFTNLGEVMAAGAENAFNKAKNKLTAGANSFLDGAKAALKIPLTGPTIIPQKVEIVKPMTVDYVDIPSYTDLKEKPKTPAKPKDKPKDSGINYIPASNTTASRASNSVNLKEKPSAGEDKLGKWTSSDNVGLQRLIRDFEILRKSGKLTAKDLQNFNDKLEDYSRKATAAGVRLDPFIDKNIKLGKELSKTAVIASDAKKKIKWDASDTKALKEANEDQQRINKAGTNSEQGAVNYNRKIDDLRAKAISAGVQDNPTVAQYLKNSKLIGDAATANAAANMKAAAAEKARKASLENLAEAVKTMSLAEIQKRLAQEKASPDMDKDRVKIYQQQEKAILAENKRTEAEKKRRAEQAQREAEKRADDARALTKDSSDNELKARENNYKSAKSALDKQLENELRAAGDNEEKKLAVLEKFAPQFDDLARDRAILDRDTALKAENEKYTDKLVQAKRNKQDTTALTKSHNAVLASINNKYNTDMANAAGQLDKQIADSSEKIKKASLDKQKKLNEDAAKNLYTDQLANMSKLSNAELAALKVQVDASKQEYLDMADGAGTAAAEVLKNISTNLTNQIKNNTLAAQQYFKNAIENAGDLQEKLDDIHAVLNPDEDQNTAENFAKGKLKPGESFLKYLDKQIKDAKTNLANMSEGDAGYAEAKAYLANLETVQKQTNDRMAVAQRQYVAEWNKTEKDRQANYALSMAKHNLELGLITKQDYANAIQQHKDYWEVRQAQVKEGSDEYLAIYAKGVSDKQEIDKNAMDMAKDAVDALKLDKIADIKVPDEAIASIDKAIASLKALKETYKDFPEIRKYLDGEIEKQEKNKNDTVLKTAKKAIDFLKLDDASATESNTAFLNNLEIKYKDFPEVLDLISDAFEKIGKTSVKALDDAEKAAEKLDKELDGVLDNANDFIKDVEKFRSGLTQDTLSLDKDDASFDVTSLEAQRDALLAITDSEKDKARITLEWSEKIRAAKLKEAEAQLKVALAANETAKAEALAKEEALGKEDEINALYDRRADNIKRNHALTIQGINDSTDASNKAAKKVLNSHEDIIKKIGEYAEYAQAGIGLLVTGMQIFGDVSEEIANQWGEDLNSMVNDLVKIGTAVAKGDWISAAVGVLQSIFNWFQRNKKAAKEAAEATKEYHKQFKFMSGDSFRKVEEYTTGILLWQTTHYKETLDELGIEIAKTIDSGLAEGLSTGIGNYLNGSGSITEAVHDSFKQAIIQAITQALLESAVIKEKLGPILENIAKGIRDGTDISGYLEEFKVATKEAAEYAEKTLDPYKKVLNDVFGKDSVKAMGTSFADAIKSGMKEGAYASLEGEGKISDYIKSNLKKAVIDAFIEATVESAYIKGGLQSYIDKITADIAAGRDPTASLNDALAQAERLGTQLETSLKPLNDLFAQDKLANFIKKLSDGLKNGFESGFRSGMQKFLEGGTTQEFLQGIKDGIKSSIINAVIDAVMNGAIIKGALGGLLTQLTESLAAGKDPSQIIGQISSVLPSIVSTLEKTLTPIRDALKIFDAPPVPVAAPEMQTPKDTASNGVKANVGAVQNNTVNNSVDLKFYITEATDADKIARMVERRVTRALLRA